MLLYRIVKHKHAATPFDGEGARRFGGRWNSEGRRCVYLASSEPLAILEILVHLENEQLLDAYRLFTIDIPSDQIMTLDSSSLPADWQAEPAPASTADIGDEWLESQVSLALSVPSTVVPRERNCIVNAEHPAMQTALKTVKELPLKLDPRLKTSRNS